MSDTNLTHQQKLIVRRISMGLTKEFPFFGHIFACCRFVLSSEVKTAGLLVGECLTVRLGEKFFDPQASYADQRFILLHEVGHFMFMHPMRSGKVLNEAKNIAMDLAVNSFLKKHSPFGLPRHASTPDQFNLEWDRSFEWYLQKLMGKQQQQQQQGQGKGKGQGQGKGNGEGEGDGEDEGKQKSKGQKPHGAGEDHQWECQVSEAEATELSSRMYSTAKVAGADPGGGLSDIYQVRTEVDWKLEFLRAAQKAELSEEWTFTKRKFSKRYGTIPGVIHDYLGELYLLVDTSGSMGPRELGACFDVVDQLANLGYFIRIFEVDTKLQQEYVYEGIPPKVKGGGGTMFQSAFKHIIEHYPECEQLIALTDGYIGDLSYGPPPVDIVWVLTPDSPDSMPFGETIRMRLNTRTGEY